MAALGFVHQRESFALNGTQVLEQVFVGFVMQAHAGHACEKDVVVKPDGATRADTPLGRDAHKQGQGQIGFRPERQRLLLKVSILQPKARQFASVCLSGVDRPSGLYEFFRRAWVNC